VQAGARGDEEARAQRRLTAQTVQGSFPYADDPENAYEVPAEVLQSGVALLQITVHYTDGSSATVQLAPEQLAAPSTSYPLVGS